MNKFLMFITVLWISPLLAQTPDATETPTITQDVGERKDFNPRESHWLTTFGFEGTKYLVPNDFSGQEKFKDSRKDYWGGRLGFGREFYLGKGFITSSRIESYYMGTLFSQTKNAGPEIEDVELANIKQVGHIWGIDLVQTLGFTFDFKTKNPIMGDMSYLTVEPFIEGGVGTAWVYNRTTYNYNLSPINEGYQNRVRDDLLNARIGVGVNLTSRTGHFLYIRATHNRYGLTQRKMETRERPNGGPEVSTTSTEKDGSIDPVNIFALGGGYKF